MPNVNTKRIEESATTALKAALLRCPILESYIDSNDKTPSWDGTVFVYKSENTKNDNLAGRVPIQIKGTTKVIISDTATFLCRVSDLKNYYKDGGCVFFLVSVDLSSGKSRIFYKTLLVVDLDKIIKDAGKQEKITIHLNLFPAEANEISSIFMQFTDNVHKQMGFIGKNIPTFESLEANGAEITSLTFTASGIGLTWDALPKFLSTHDFYLYATVKGLDVDVPIDKVSKAIVSKPVDGEVRVKERCFFPSYRVVYEKGTPRIRIGKGICIDIRTEEKRITVHTDRPDTLSDFIVETEFFLEMAEQGELTLNGVALPLNGASLSDLQERKKTLEYCKDIKKMLDYLGVTEELCLNNLSENDEKNLKNFTGAVLYNRKIGFPNIAQDQFYGAFKIANLSIWIWANRQSDGMYSIDSFFTVNDKGENLPLQSLAGMLKKKYEQEPIFQSSFTPVAIQNSIMMFDRYNAIRNGHSYAHDNPILDAMEAEFAVRIMADVISFIDKAEAYRKQMSKTKMNPELDFDSLFNYYDFFAFLPADCDQCITGENQHGLLFVVLADFNATAAEQAHG